MRRAHTMYHAPGGLSRLSLFFSPSYNPDMNKRAKKRLKETIEKENLKRAESKKDQNSFAPKKDQLQRGFLPKPEKKRG